MNISCDGEGYYLSILCPTKPNTAGSLCGLSQARQLLPLRATWDLLVVPQCPKPYPVPLCWVPGTLPLSTHLGPHPPPHLHAHRGALSTLNGSMIKTLHSDNVFCCRSVYSRCVMVETSFLIHCSLCCQHGAWCIGGSTCPSAELELRRTGSLPRHLSPPAPTHCGLFKPCGGGGMVVVVISFCLLYPSLVFLFLLIQRSSIYRLSKKHTRSLLSKCAIPQASGGRSAPGRQQT